VPPAAWNPAPYGRTWRPSASFAARRTAGPGQALRCRFRECAAEELAWDLNLAALVNTVIIWSMTAPCVGGPRGRVLALWFLTVLESWYAISSAPSPIGAG
jgi:hypothetical protein